MFGDDENVAASRPTAFTSAYRVTAQKPGPSGSSWRWTGSCSRSQANWACGCPWANDAGDSRSMATWSVSVTAPGWHGSRPAVGSMTWIARPRTAASASREHS